MSSNRSLAQRQAIAAATTAPDLIGAMMAFSSAGGLDDTDAGVEAPEPFTAADKAGSAALADGLRAIADLIQTRPDLYAEYFRWSSSLTDILIPVSSAEDPRAAMADIMRAARRHGASVTKSYNDEWGHALAQFGPVTLKVYAKREQVCTRVVTGTETVTVMLPDPAVEVPMVEVEQTREIVEWRCEPLLSGSEATA